MSRRKLPDPENEGQPGAYTFDGAILKARGYSVFSHSDDPVPGRTPPNAVLFVLHTAVEADEGSPAVPFNVALRFKSRAAVDELVDCLERHGVDVWPKGPRP